MGRIWITGALVGLAMLAVSTKPTSAQAPLSSALTPAGISGVSANRARVDRPTKWRFNDTAWASPVARFRPHRHWSWLFPDASTVSPRTDPLELRHGWRDPLLRRHWWR